MVRLNLQAVSDTTIQFFKLNVEYANEVRCRLNYISFILMISAPGKGAVIIDIQTGCSAQADDIV